MSAVSSWSRNKRLGYRPEVLGLPFQFYRKTKPKLDSSLYNLASLSKPAANPTGF